MLKEQPEWLHKPELSMIYTWHIESPRKSRNEKSGKS